VNEIEETKAEIEDNEDTSAIDDLLSTVQNEK